MPNHLADETSPYLQQHAHNPVDWYPWGEAALGRARAEDKPILLSIGYSACHWCHVMARESFENEDIARLMNRHFINIKVDREERPDLDSIYMAAVQAVTGSGGWPLTVFLTPEGKPFFGGTYFPPEDHHGLPGLPRVLSTVADAYRNRRGDIEKTAEHLVAALRAPEVPAAASETLTVEVLARAFASLQESFDPENGGFGLAPKFPQPLVLEYLLRYYHRYPESHALEMVDLALKRMARGGIYDQLGGGFHRYATDARWQVPHFEKMLYDNALLSQVYLHAYLVTGRVLYRDIAEQTLDYVLGEMTSPEGGFYSAQDADSEGVEGKYYLWPAAEFDRAVGPRNRQLLRRYFGVSDEGNFEGGNILHVAEDTLPPPAGVLRRARAALLRRRQERVKPGRDEKVLASWNGLMLASLAEAASVLERADYLAAAEACGSFLLGAMLPDGRLRHSYRDGRARIDGYLQDYAAVIEGLLQLHVATFAGRWLQQAIGLAEVMTEQFWDEATGRFYETAEGHGGLLIRPLSLSDGVLPSGGAMAALVLLKLSRLTGDRRFEAVAVRSLGTVRPSLGQNPLGFGQWLGALDFYLAETTEVVLIGRRDDPRTRALRQTLGTVWLPNKVVVARDPADPTPLPGVSLLEGRGLLKGRPAAYVCRGTVCRPPVTDATSLSAQL
ncbi:MAG: thioredoxin domain-containing protein [Chloroflexota bacterium]